MIIMIIIICHHTHLLTSLGGGHDVWFAVLDQLGVVELELEGLQPRDQPLDVGEADGELLGLGEVIVLSAVLLQLVELVRGGEVLDQGLEQVLGEHARVAP